jgi:hypothetical protein
MTRCSANTSAADETVDPHMHAQLMVGRLRNAVCQLGEIVAELPQSGRDYWQHAVVGALADLRNVEPQLFDEVAAIPLGTLTEWCSR